MHLTLPPRDTRVLSRKEYRRCYNMGWNASGGSSRASAPMDVAEDRWLTRHGYTFESAEAYAWNDGWLDFACNRDKYHFETCDGEHRSNGEECHEH